MVVSQGREDAGAEQGAGWQGPQASRPRCLLPTLSTMFISARAHILTPTMNSCLDSTPDGDAATIEPILKNLSHSVVRDALVNQGWFFFVEETIQKNMFFFPTMLSIIRCAGGPITVIDMISSVRHEVVWGWKVL